jgi:hypothetical protein
VPRVTKKVAALSPERVQESDEVYILSTQSDASVKIRDEHKWPYTRGVTVASS